MKHISHDRDPHEIYFPHLMNMSKATLKTLFKLAQLNLKKRINPLLMKPLSQPQNQRLKL